MAKRLMDGFRTFAPASLFAFVLSIQAAQPVSAASNDDRWGWRYCAPPYPPACARSNTNQHPVDASCARDVDSYLDAVFRYRTCLTNEMERAVREANRTVQIVKCPKDKRYCYGLSTNGQQ